LKFAQGDTAGTGAQIDRHCTSHLVVCTRRGL
jgi:hypothetical protein